MPRLLAVALLFLYSLAALAGDGGKHFLWRVSKGDAVIYVAGTVHVLRQSDYPLPDVLESTFKSSAGLVEEIDLNHFDPESAQLQMLKIGSYPSGHSMKTDLPPAIYQRVVQLIKQQKVEMGDLESMKPWMASIVLLDTQLAISGFDPSTGVDIHFSEEADALKKPSLGLETGAYQLNMLDALPEKDQEAMLLQSLDQADDVQKDMDYMMTAWRHGDAAALEKELKDEFGPYPDVYQAILVQRNRNWVPQLEKLAGSGKQYFVAVGALHLVGPDGVLAALQKDGYKVEQL